MLAAHYTSVMEKRLKIFVRAVDGERIPPILWDQMTMYRDECSRLFEQNPLIHEESLRLLTGEQMVLWSRCGLRIAPYPEEE